MVKSFCQPRKCQMKGHQVLHEFLYVPECPVPLLGRDLLSKLRAQVTFSPEERPTFQMDTMTYLLSLSIPPQDEWRLHEPPKAEPGGRKSMLLLLLLSRFSRVRLCGTPLTAAHQAPPSLGFSRQEHWSGLPFPSPMHEGEK